MADPAIRLSDGLVRDLRLHLDQSGAGIAEPGLARWCRDLRGSLETLLLQQGPRILSLDVPLANPPGFRQLLADVFGEGFFASYHEITDCRGQAVADFPPSARCIHGHVALGPLRARYPDARLITWVMDPVRRVAAHYDYWRREPDWSNPLCAAMHRNGWSLLDFARQDGAREDMVRFFGGLEPAAFTFIGLAGEPAASADLLMRRLEVTAVPVFQVWAGSATTPPAPPLSASDAAEIAALNPLSCRLHAACVAWFGAACRDAGLRPGAS